MLSVVDEIWSIAGTHFLTVIVNVLLVDVKVVSPPDAIKFWVISTLTLDNAEVIV